MPDSSTSSRSSSPWIVVRNSRIHGRGVFAARPIPKGTRVVEYVGDRVSHAEADARYDDHDPNDNHTFLFIVDRRTVIDAGVGGNEARFINHSCDGNCESVIEKGRVYIEAVRAIAKGEELGYDYEIGREKDDPPNVDEIYACRCGSPKCRGTMLWPARRPEPKARRPRRARKTARAAPAKDGASGARRAPAPRAGATQRASKRRKGGRARAR
jgi:SET domain-containing protein